MHRSSTILVASLCASAASARDPLLVRAHSLYNDLKFEEARAAFEQAASVRMGSIDEVADAYLGLGLVDATLGDEVGARTAFLRLLAVKPEAQLEGNDISPRQRAPFDAAKLIAQGKSPPNIAHIPAGAWLPNQPTSMHVDVTSDWLGIVHGVRLLIRPKAVADDGGASSAHYQEISVAGKPPFDLAVPPLSAGAVEYYLEATDEHGCPVSSWKTAEAPQVVDVNPPLAGTPIYKQPLVWVGVGAVVVAVATVLIVTSLQEPTYGVQTRP
jgi:hypothetical protein